MTWLVLLALGALWLIVWIISLFDGSSSQTTAEDRQRRWQQRHAEKLAAAEKRQNELEIQRALAVEKDANEVDRLIREHDDVIRKFLEIAERKVSVLDDYGDESWSQLPKCVEECIQKIAEREGVAQAAVRAWLRAKPAADPFGFTFSFESGPPVQFRRVAQHLDTRFREYHSNRPRTDQTTADFSGTQFETHIAKLLPHLGFTDIRGTPVTGDQGADLLARLNGRLFVIQAKRYRGSVGNRAVQEVAAAVQFYGGDEGWVVTNSVFTPAAKALAQKNGVRLVDGHVLAEIERRVRGTKSSH